MIYRRIIETLRWRGKALSNAVREPPFSRAEVTAARPVSHTGRATCGLSASGKGRAMFNIEQNAGGGPTMVG